MCCKPKFEISVIVPALKHHAMMTSGGTEIALHVYLTKADESESLTSSSGDLPHEKIPRRFKGSLNLM
jgi:hypothetical protein